MALRLRDDRGSEAVALREREGETERRERDAISTMLLLRVQWE